MTKFRKSDDPQMPVVPNAKNYFGTHMALQDLLNAVLDVLAVMDDDAEVMCPWCGRNPHWRSCDILPKVQYAQLVLNAPPVPKEK